MGRNWIPDVAVVGVIKLVLHALLRELQRAGLKKGKPNPRMVKLLKAKEAYEARIQKECLNDSSIPLKTKRIVREVYEVFGKDTILVNENGSQDLWSYYWPYFKVGSINSCVAPGEQTCMGGGCSAAIGAKLPMPEKDVVCTTGDGAFQMFMKELATAAQQKAPVTYVILNNFSLGWIKWGQRNRGNPPGSPLVWASPGAINVSSSNPGGPSSPWFCSCRSPCVWQRQTWISDAIWTSQPGHWVFPTNWAGKVLHAFIVLGAVLVLTNLEWTFRASVGTSRWKIKYAVLGVALLFGVRIYSSSQVILYSANNVQLIIFNSLALTLACGLLAVWVYRSRLHHVDLYPSSAVLHKSFTVLLAGAYLVVVGIKKPALYTGLVHRPAASFADHCAHLEDGQVHGNHQAADQGAQHHRMIIGSIRLAMASTASSTSRS